MKGLHVHGKCLLGRWVFEGEILSLLEVEIRKRVRKMFVQRTRMEFVRERVVCKENGVGNRKVRCTHAL